MILGSISRFFRTPIGLMAIAIMVILILNASGIQFSVYRPGWELAADIIGIKNDVGPYLAFYVGFPPQAKFLPFYNADGPSTTMMVDWDDPQSGYPNVQVTVSGIREEVPAYPYATLSRDFEKFRYIVNYHEYVFDVQIRTIADVAMTGNGYWVHETSMEKNLRAYPVGDKYNPDDCGKAFSGGTYVRFSVRPWMGFDAGTPPENYTFNTYWLGVMDATVDKTQIGYAASEPPPETWKGWVRNLASVNSIPSMYQDDSSFSNNFESIPWDANKILDSRIQSSIIVYLPFNIMAGAYELDDYFAGYPNGIKEVKPVDYYATYTVRMSSLVIKEYEARNPGTPPNAGPIEPPSDQVNFTQADWWGTNLWWVLLVVFGVLILIAIIGVFVGIPILALLTRPMFLFQLSEYPLLSNRIHVYRDGGGNN